MALRSTATAAAACAVGMLLLAGCDANPARGIPSLLWHSVGQGNPADPYDVPAAEFDAALALIEQAGGTTVTLDQVFDAAEDDSGRPALPPRPVIITFDDGRQNWLTQAMPLLQKHGMVAEAFVVTGRLAEDDAHRYVEHTPRGDYPYLLWPELAQMAQSGAFRVESHSLTHPRLARRSASSQRDEIARSRAILRERLGVPCSFFAYPFGSFSATTSLLAEAAGYRGAMAVHSGINERFSMDRVSIHRGELDRVRRALSDHYGAF